MLTTVHLEEIVLELRALKPIPRRIGVLGITPSTAAVIAALRAAGFSDEIAGVIQAGDTPHVTQRIAGVPVVPPGEQIANFDVVVVASDRDKELLLRHYRASLAATSAHDLLPVILFAGSAHLGFDDRVPNTVLGDILPLSLANGYPNSLPHLYEALASVAARHLPGAIVEFGAYRGGTTAFSRRRLARSDIGHGSLPSSPSADSHLAVISSISTRIQRGSSGISPPSDGISNRSALN